MRTKQRPGYDVDPAWLVAPRLYPVESILAVTPGGLCIPL